VPGERLVAEETAVAFTYNGTSHAVMMATPADLEDFAAGLSLTEGMVETVDDISDLAIVNTDLGIELRMWICDAHMRSYAARRRVSAGPTGCGLCGIESLAEASRPARRVGEGLRLAPEEISAAMATLSPAQALNRETRAVHAAAFWQPRQGLVAVREDVGRHNALDKLVGHSPTGRSTAAAASWSSPAAFQSRWYKRPPFSAPRSSLPCRRRRRLRSASLRPAG
jgi:FdhD protein